MDLSEGASKDDAVMQTSLCLGARSISNVQKASESCEEMHTALDEGSPAAVVHKSLSEPSGVQHNAPQATPLTKSSGQASGIKKLLDNFYEILSRDPRLQDLLFRYDPSLKTLSGMIQKAKIAFNPSHLPLVGFVHKVVEAKQVGVGSYSIRALPMESESIEVSEGDMTEELIRMKKNLDAYAARQGTRASINNESLTDLCLQLS